MVGKEERNKDFLQNFAEDEHGNAIDQQNMEALYMEQGTSSAATKDEKKVVDEKPVVKEKDDASSVEVQEKVHVEHAEDTAQETK